MEDDFLSEDELRDLWYILSEMEEGEED